MLYIYVIQNRASSPEVYSHYFSAAIRCQSHISAIAEKGSLSERYCLVLEELRGEALRQTKHMNPSTAVSLEAMGTHSQENGFQTNSMQMDTSSSTATNYPDLMGGGAMDFDGMPTSGLSGYSAWGQFASMVSSGLGNLDAFLNDDSLRF